MAKYLKNIISYEDLKEKYKRLLKTNHPDNGGKLEVMQEINCEYDALFKIWKDRAIKENTIKEEEKEETARSTKRTFYSAYGWEGSRYDSNLSLKEIAKIVRNYTKEKYPTFKFSVRTSYASMCQELHVELKEAPHDIYMTVDDLRSYGLEYYPIFSDGTQAEYSQYKEDISLMMRRWRDRDIFTFDCWSEEDIYNTYAALTEDQLHFFGLLKEDISEILKDVDSFVNSYNYDDSDSMTDYFNVNFYYFNCKYSEVKIVPKVARVSKKDYTPRAPKETKESTTAALETNGENFTVTESEHTKTHEKIYLVKCLVSLSRDDYKLLNNLFKDNGGYYSRFTHSFIFKNDPTEFLKGVKIA